MDTKCAPGVGNKKICYTLNHLKYLAKAYNKNHTDKIKIGKNKVTIFNQLQDKYKNQCKDSSCWIKKLKVNGSCKEELLDNFKPEMPTSWKKNMSEWLSTLDINAVMEQYEDKYSNFRFMGALPIDCPSGYLCNLSNLNLAKEKKKGFNVFGIVFNLDRHYQPGSHWVACVIDNKKNNLIYYDSNGIQPPSDVLPFIKKMNKQLTSINKKKVNLLKNTTRHQSGNSECGIFSINFIIKYLEGDSFKKIIKSKPTDKNMNQLRRTLYRN